MKNPERAPPTEMSASARAGEITAILAAAIVRTVIATAQKQSKMDLDFLPDQSVHAIPYQQEIL